MKTFGGFLELELPRRRQPLHVGVTALASGRACLHRILRELRPTRVWLPFYICDAVLQAVAAAGAEPDFYAIDEGWTPRRDPPRGDDVMVVVNYFGLGTSIADEWAARSARVVIDDSQAFFRRGSNAAWSFNSARKFFGVPDGGYLYGPIDHGAPYPGGPTGHADHLVGRVLGDAADAYVRYQAHERRFTADICAMSPLSVRLLDTIDYAAVAAARRENFSIAHAVVGAVNRLPVALGGEDVPLYYPLCPIVPMEHQRLWDAGVFAPRLWPEVVARSQPGFAYERRLAQELLPLPIDQRYQAADVKEMCERVLSCVRTLR